MGGCISVKAELNAALKDLITDANFRSEKVILQHFVQMNKGATNIILKTLFDSVQITLILIKQTTIQYLIACN
jgi:hypothetical protein